MPETSNGSSEIADILWESLVGGDYDVPALQRTVRNDSPLSEIGLDSLDMTDFLIRIEDRYQIGIRKEDYPQLLTIDAIEAYVRARLGVEDGICGLPASP